MFCMTAVPLMSFADDRFSGFTAVITSECEVDFCCITDNIIKVSSDVTPYDYWLIIKFFSRLIVHQMEIKENTDT